MSSAALKAVKDREVESAISFQTNSNPIEFEYDSIEEAFPAVAPGREPLGHNILVQVRQPKTHTKGGILLSQNVRDTEHYNTRVAKVIAVGPLCFTSTKTVKEDGRDPESFNVPWPEGQWFKPGDFVEIPQYGGSRFVVKYTAMREEFDPGPGKMVPKKVQEEVTFAFFRAKDVIALITCSPLAIKAYTD